MPELIEVEHTCRILNQSKGQSLSGIKNSKYISSLYKFSKSKPSALKKIVNFKLVEWQRHGKKLFAQFKDSKNNSFYLYSHLGMSGSWRTLSTDSPLPKHSHLQLIFKNKTKLVYVDPRRFGHLDLIEELPEFQAPDPFVDKKFNGLWIFKKIQNSNKQIKELLLDQKIFAGIGNYLASEILYHAKISPFLLGKDISLEECKLLKKSITAILKRAYKAGGLSMRDYVIPDGQKGIMKLKIKVYGRDGELCSNHPKTEDIKILKCTIAQRATFYCASCQS